MKLATEQRVLPVVLPIHEVAKILNALTRFSARAFGENLTQERRFSGIGFVNGFFSTDGILYAPVDSPRVVGLELELSY